MKLHEFAFSLILALALGQSVLVERVRAAEPAADACIGELKRKSGKTVDFHPAAAAVDCAAIPDADTENLRTGGRPQFRNFTGEDLLAFGEKGPVVRIAFDAAKGRNIYLVSDPVAIQELLGSTRAAPGIPQQRISSGLPSSGPKLIGGEIFFGNGEAWRNRRTMVQSLFAAQAIERKTPEIVATIGEFLQTRWKKIAEKAAPIDLLDEMRRLSFRVLFKSFVGISDPELTEDAYQAFNTFFRPINDGRILNPEFPEAERAKVMEAKEKVDGITRKIMADRRAAGFPDPENNLVDRLGRGKSETGAPLTEDQILGEMRTFYLAGSDATAWVLAQALNNLARYPETASNLLEELSKIGSADHPWSGGDIRKCPYLSGFLNESMRLSPPLYTMTSSFGEDIEILGRRIPANSLLVFSPEAQGRDPSIWRDPRKFDPTRVFKAKETTAFGGGERICVGMALAIREASLAFAMIAQSYDVVAVTELRPTLSSVARATAPTQPYLVTIKPKGSPGVDTTTPKVVAILAKNVNTFVGKNGRAPNAHATDPAERLSYMVWLNSNALPEFRDRLTPEVREVLARAPAPEWGQDTGPVKYAVAPLLPPLTGEDGGLDVTHPRTGHTEHFNTVYLRTEEERAPYRLTVQNGKLYDASGKLFDTSDSVLDGLSHTEGRAILVMDESGAFYGLKIQIRGTVHHSTPLAGGPIAFGGEVVVKEGVLTLLGNRTGHHLTPGAFSLRP
jgi:pentalenene oxygenase